MIQATTRSHGILIASQAELSIIAMARIPSTREKVSTVIAAHGTYIAESRSNPSSDKGLPQMGAEHQEESLRRKCGDIRVEVDRLVHIRAGSHWKST